MVDRTYPLEIVYDGDCAICRCDVARLRQRDDSGRLIFIDIADPDVNPASYGRTREQLLARIHARRADGTVVDGPEVFRLAWAAVGLGWLAAPTRLPILDGLTEVAYDWFARHRVGLSRRFGGLFRRLTPTCDAGRCPTAR